ncbi:hypothetical protein K2173_020398 [Erythroxylum novogranatense]|uniref:Glycine-rich protein n=1 Tax=Erythroxylum novogranatense TaxID=1862640 RepID=A0AAV8TG90_9ROSI|nr:hypothetical protein K2173_020398 [Erythroxylum novogranatense]
MNGYGAGRSEEEEKGLLWKLPEVRLKDLGKVGPGFGLGAGCGIGFGVGLFGFGVGASCGVGYGFGYGVGRGVAHDDKRRYSNIGKYFQGPGNLPTHRVKSLCKEHSISTCVLFMKRIFRYCF